VESVLRVALIASLVMLAAPASRAQSSGPIAPSLQAHPFPGFVSSYEVTRTLRAAGFDPLAPPLREGTTFVVRATDYRGILMRVVVDARTGAIRDANRIVPGPGRYGQFYGPPPPYGPVGMEGGFAVPEVDGIAPYAPPPPARSTGRLPESLPPLPRPRPAALASRKTAVDSKPANLKAAPSTPAATENEKPAPTHAEPHDTAGQATQTPTGSEVTTAAPPAGGAAKKAPVPVPPLND